MSSAYHGALGSWGGELEHTASTDRFVARARLPAPRVPKPAPIACARRARRCAARTRASRSSCPTARRRRRAARPGLARARGRGRRTRRRAALATGDPDASAAVLLRTPTRPRLEAAAAAEEHYSGEFVPYVVENELRPHSWLPNDDFLSEHMALLAVFDWSNDELIAHWAKPRRPVMITIAGAHRDHTGTRARTFPARVHVIALAVALVDAGLGCRANRRIVSCGSAGLRTR